MPIHTILTREGENTNQYSWGMSRINDVDLFDSVDDTTDLESRCFEVEQ